MRYILSATVLGLLVSAAFPAAAQTNTQNNTQTNWQQQQPMYAVPMYVSPTGSQQMYSNQNGAVPFYNNNAQPLPVDQLIAGKNAPSYDYGDSNVYTGFGSSDPLAGVTSMGSLTPQQERYVRAQRDAQAAAYQRDYLSGAGVPTTTQATTQTGASAYQGAAFSDLYTNLQPEKEKAPVRRRVVYKERNNPLTTPPRLFSVD